MNGAETLDSVRTHLERFVAYPNTWAADAHALWIAHTHLMNAWESTPRIAFLSPEPGSGKSRALEVTEPLVPRPVYAVNTSPAYLFRKVSDEAGPPTILYDEIDTVFGPKAKDNEDIRGMLNAGHRRGATAGRCVVRGKEIFTEELPAYCAVALAGLNDLPDTIMTRSVVIRMRRRAKHERVEPWRLRINGPESQVIFDHLAQWAASVESKASAQWPDMPEGVEDRNADVWEALISVADLAGGDWPQRARVAAVTAVTDLSRQKGESLGIRLLSDLRSVFAGRARMSTTEVLDALNGMTESPWGNLRGKELDARALSRFLSKYEVRPRLLRIEGQSGPLHGYDAADLADPWGRYVAPVPRQETVTSVTGATAPPSAACTVCRPPLAFDDGTGCHATCEAVA
ncbi:DUF3631 domain-containing protein [Demequina lutea]|uniref:DUF3631 domain-containing protein n=1 Tax=Demequina lutea TaxID=431489 RepID=UPI000A92E239|nr:DUF3631 domain-containing protein [Demequina lutea]